jgi:hypothetical protein
MSAGLASLADGFRAWRPSYDALQRAHLVSPQAALRDLHLQCHRVARVDGCLEIERTLGILIGEAGEPSVGQLKFVHIASRSSAASIS